MKKYDFIIIGIILVAIALLSIFFLNSYKVNDAFAIDILFKNELIYSFSLDDNGEYKIQCVDNELNIYKDDALIKAITVESKDFDNTFVVCDSEVRMIDASCSGKNCTKMYITKSHILPIVCTNGIVISPSESSNIDIIV